MKPGATTLPAASIRLLRGRVGKPPDRRDPAIANADVRGVPRRAGAVDDMAVRDDDVERRRRCLGQRGQRDGD